MRAITLWQPWASLIAEGVKTIETRPKRSPWSFAIGQTIAIHAAKRAPYLIEGTTVAEYALRAGWVDLEGLPLGAIVATCTLADVVPMRAASEGRGVGAVLQIENDGALFLWPNKCVRDDPDATDQRPFGDFAPGRHALLLDNVVKLAEPVQVRGHQGLWRLPRAAEALVEHQTHKVA